MKGFPPSLCVSDKQTNYHFTTSNNLNEMCEPFWVVRANMSTNLTLSQCAAREHSLYKDGSMTRTQVATNCSAQHCQAFCCTILACAATLSWSEAAAHLGPNHQTPTRQGLPCWLAPKASHQRLKADSGTTAGLSTGTVGRLRRACWWPYR